MKMRYFDSIAPMKVPTKAPANSRPLLAQFKPLLTLTLLAGLTSACELIIDKASGPSIPKDNPGINANLPATFPNSPNDNGFGITSAQKTIQTCYVGDPCEQEPAGHITYNYDANFHLLTATERSTDPSSSLVSHRHYFYNGTRLDKVVVSSDSSNSATATFHTLHDYTYDDEDDGAYQANNNLTRPKLRREYICEINVVGDALAILENCNALTAIEVINYVYYETGFLYRKEFDVDNDTLVEHQKIYRYDTENRLIRVDTDNFYNGEIDERYTYEWLDNALTVLIDHKFANPDTRGTKLAISYQLNDNTMGRTVNKECYFKNEEALECKGNSRHAYHWEFTWQAASCWAGGLDDIDPEARAINYLCKEPNN